MGSGQVRSRRVARGRSRGAEVRWAAPRRGRSAEEWRALGSRPRGTAPPSRSDTASFEAGVDRTELRSETAEATELPTSVRRAHASERWARVSSRSGARGPELPPRSRRPAPGGSGSTRRSRPRLPLGIRPKRPLLRFLFDLGVPFTCVASLWSPTLRALRGSLTRRVTAPVPEVVRVLSELRDAERRVGVHMREVRLQPQGCRRAQIQGHDAHEPDAHARRCAADGRAPRTARPGRPARPRGDRGRCRPCWDGARRWTPCCAASPWRSRRPWLRRLWRSVRCRSTGQPGGQSARRDDGHRRNAWRLQCTPCCSARSGWRPEHGR